MKKVVLVTVPRYGTTSSYGLQVLAKNLDPSTTNVSFFDANLDLYRNWSKTDLWEKIEIWGIQQHDCDQDPELWTKISSICNQWAKHIVDQTPDIVGISVFTHESRNWTKLLCYSIKSLNPNITIVIGGRGLNNPGEPKAHFAKYCLDWQLCDYFFNGESEIEFKKFLNGEPCVVNNFDTALINKDLNLTNVKIQNYQDYNFSSSWYGENDNFLNTHHVVDSDPDYFKMTSTRGCVKRCTFCDVHLMRPEFSFRSAENVFEEIKHAINQGHRKICFTDDMINGSNRQFISWQELLANYLEKHNITDFKWTAQLGIKSKLSIPKEMFSLLRRTGAQITIGVDHFSNSVLDHMNKLYTADDIFWFFDQGHEHSINYRMLLFIIGYPTETREDFEILKNGIKTLAQYKKQVQVWDFGSTCSIPEGSVLSTMPGMQLGNNQNNWTYTPNVSLTSNEKIQRRIELDDLGKQLELVVRKKRTQWLRIDSWANV